MKSTHPSPEQLRTILQAAVHPRAEKDKYVSAMQPLFVLMCFGEQSILDCAKPYLDEGGIPQFKHKTNSGGGAILSDAAKIALNGLNLSYVIPPPEEAFICLVLSKYLMTKLLQMQEDLGFGQSPPPFKPWQKDTNKAYDQGDLSWYFEHAQRINEIALKDSQENHDRKDRWMHFDFPDAIGVRGGSSSASQDDTSASGSKAASTAFANSWVDFGAQNTDL